MEEVGLSRSCALGHWAIPDSTILQVVLRNLRQLLMEGSSHVPSTPRGFVIRAGKGGCH